MVVVKQRMERIGTDTLRFYVTWYSPLALPLGELSPKVTERVLQPGIPSPSSLRSSTSPKGRGKGCFASFWRNGAYCMRGENAVKEDEKKPLSWEVADPKPPVIQSGHMESRKEN